MRNETLSVIRRRRSTRAYLDRQVDRETLLEIIEAGKYAPYAGDQGWHFTVVQNQGMLRKINEAAKTGATMMGVPHMAALAANPEFNCLYHAPTLVIISGDQEKIAIETDCAAAAENMLIAAEALDVGGCWLFFPTVAFMFDQDGSLSEELKIPQGYKPFVTLSLGYRAAPAENASTRREGTVTFVE